MKNLTPKDIALLVMFLLIVYIFKALIPLLIIVGIYFYIKSKKKPKIEPQRRINVSQQDNLELEQYKANLEECEELIADVGRIRREVDLRQFQGRKDVTKEELADYMFEQQYWNGAYERSIYMEEIIKVCNLNSDDIAWVKEELEHYHPFREGTYLGDTLQENQSFTFDNRVCKERSDEDKAVAQYMNEIEKEETIKYINKLKSDRQKEVDFLKQIDMYNEEFEKQFDESVEKSINYALQDLRRCDYETWLHEKGYVK